MSGFIPSCWAEFPPKLKLPGASPSKSSTVEKPSKTGGSVIITSSEYWVVAEPPLRAVTVTLYVPGPSYEWESCSPICIGVASFPASSPNNTSKEAA